MSTNIGAEERPVESARTAARPRGRDTDAQASEAVSAGLQLAILSESVTTAERATTSPGFGVLLAAAVLATTGEAVPQVVVASVRSFGALLRPVESVTTRVSW